MILVTGHKGYIGSALYEKLLKLKYDVRGIDLKEGDDLLYCLPQGKCDTVFHMAALPSVEYSIKNPSYSLRQNVFVTSRLLEWSKNSGVRRFIFSSSAAAEGNNGTPESPYGLHKLMSEMECRLFSNLYDLETVCLRYYNVYSEHQPYGGPYSTALSAWMEMIRLNKPLRIDGDGNQTRDFIHVDDVVSANIHFMHTNIKLNGKALNVGTGQGVSLNYIKDYIDRAHKVDWIHAPSRKGDVRHSTADISDIIGHGWSPQISIEEGLERCFRKEI